MSAKSKLVRSGTRMPARELETIALWVQGHTYEAIARELNVKPTTVREHLQRAKKRLGATTKVEFLNAARWAVEARSKEKQ